MKKAREPKSDRDKKATREIFSTEGGLSRLTDALAAGTGAERIRLNAAGLTVNSGPSGFEVRWKDGGPMYFRQVVSTVGAHALRAVFPFFPQRSLAAVESLPYAAIVQAAVGFRKWEGLKLNAFGGLIPFRENRRVLGALFMSSQFKNRAPAGGALISSFIGGVRKPEMIGKDDAQIRMIVEEEFKSLFGLTKWAPELLVINRYPHAIPQYGIGSEERLRAISELERDFPGLILAGNIRDGIGISDRIRQGKNVAEKIKNI